MLKGINMNKYFLYEIMKLDSDNSLSLTNSIVLLSKYVDVKLMNSEDNNLYYTCKVDDILKSNIDNEELIEIRNGGWELSNDKECLIKKL